MNLEAIMLREINTATKGQILYDFAYRGSLAESNSQRQKVDQWVLGGWGGGWELVFNEDRVSAGKDGKSAGAGRW